MNILFIAGKTIDPDKGGVQRVTHVLGNELKRNGCQVYFLALARGNFFKLDQIPHYYIEDENSIYNTKNINYIVQILKTNKIEIIINQGCVAKEQFRLLSQVKNETPGLKLITVFHNSIQAVFNNYQNIIRENFADRKWSQLLDFPLFWKAIKLRSKAKSKAQFNKVISGSDIFVVLFPDIIKEFKKMGVKFDERKVKAIPNPTPFSPIEGIEIQKKNRLLYVGRINYQQKRTDLLIELWKLLYKKFPEWELDVVGDGPKLRELKDKAKSDNLERINFYGFSDPRPYFEKAKFFCMTSAFEGFGLVLVEAQAHGAVPFAFHCFGSLPEIIENNKTGVIIPPFNTELYATKLLEMMLDEENRKRMALLAQHSVKRYLPGSVAKQWMHLFNELYSHD